MSSTACKTALDLTEADADACAGTDADAGPPSMKRQRACDSHPASGKRQLAGDSLSMDSGIYLRITSNEPSPGAHPLMISDEESDEPSSYTEYRANLPPLMSFWRETRC